MCNLASAYLALVNAIIARAFQRLDVLKYYPPGPWPFQRPTQRTEEGSR